MGLDVPDLDDRTFEELLTDARKRIPVHSDSWTDHNLSDPGITILETLVWVAESDIYQLDRVTDRHVRKYLRLLGVRPNKPQAATASLKLTNPPSTAFTEVENGTTLSADDRGTSYRFRTTQALALPDTDVTAVVSETRDGPVDNTRANQTEGLHFLPFGREAAEGSAVYLGFDTDPFRAGERLDLSVDFHEATLPAPASHGCEAGPFEPSVTVVWEHCTDVDRFNDPRAWTQVEAQPSGNNSDATDETSVQDGTNHLYHGGRVSIPKPGGWTGRDHAPFELEKPRFWLRARIAESGHEVPPQVNAFRTGVVEAEHRTRYRNEPLVRVPDGMSAAAARGLATEEQDDTTTMRPGQEFVFRRVPVLDCEVTVGDSVWDRVDDFDASGPEATAYVLEHERGVVRFGDGVRGRVPDPDQAVEARWYEHGGGEAGNVSGDAAWGIDDETAPSVAVAPRGPATGGADAESTDSALARLKADLREPYRAVTEADYRYLATHTPGLRFGRAAVHIDTRGESGDDCARQGLVTVAVVPYSPPYRDRPRASDGFLSAVADHLERHRLLTDEVEVVRPRYVGVRVAAHIEIADGFATDSTVSDVEAALERFIDPLEGFDGDGWPFGRPVYRSEVYETIEGVDGVDCVVDVDLAAGAPGTRGDDGIDLPPTGLAYLDGTTVTTEPEGRDRGGWSA